MPGLPPEEYDKGEDCVSCPALDELMPARLKCTFENIIVDATSTIRPTRILVCEQQTGNPCNYVIIDPLLGELVRVRTWSAGGPSGNMFIDYQGTGGQIFFRSTVPPSCEIETVRDNDIVATPPTNPAFYGGTCKVEPG